MGGNALSSPTRRLPAPEYRVLRDQVLRALHAATGGKRRIAEVPAYRLKPDFGDLDILIESDGLPQDFEQDLRTLLSPRELVRNGPVWSFDVSDFQVDLILTPGEYFDFSLRYFSWNDAGNLIGRVAHKLGFKFGHKGLLYPVRDGTHLLDEVVVTLDPDAAITFLGFDNAAHRGGFDTLEQMYSFVAGGKHFSPDIYLLENRNHTARTRDRKRPTYMRFLQWLKDVGPEAMERPGKDVMLAMAIKTFPDFAVRLSETLERAAWQRAAKAKFNGNVVSKWTGRSGKSLGELMSAFRREFGCAKRLHGYVLDASDAELRDRVLQLHRKLAGDPPARSASPSP